MKELEYLKAQLDNEKKLKTFKQEYEDYSSDINKYQRQDELRESIERERVMKKDFEVKSADPEIE